MDEQLHAERLDGRERRLHDARLERLPDGAFVLEGRDPWLVLGRKLLHWTPAGYDARRRRPRGAATLITPPSALEVLAAGWEGAVPLLHPTAATPGST
jgi:hypothetical protein